MNIDAKQKILDDLYRLYDETVAPVPSACRKGCAHCCTRNVTVTTLEGWRLVDGLDAEALSRLTRRLAGATRQDRFRPQVTINALAEMAAADQDPPDEVCDPAWTPCALLQDALCPVYGLRPFACRCMLSTSVCSTGGFAAMDDYLVTVNTVFQQVIEHLDVPGVTGNLVDVLAFFGNLENRSIYRTGMIHPQAVGLPANRPVKLLMIPPEHHDRIQPVVARIQALMAG